MTLAIIFFASLVCSLILFGVLSLEIKSLQKQILDNREYQHKINQTQLECLELLTIEPPELPK